MMTTNILILLLITFMLAVMTLTLQYNHFLMALFCLEAMMLSSMLMIILITYLNNMMLPNIALLLLTMGACEASIGLSIMVSMSRSTGSDHMNSMNIMKC